MCSALRETPLRELAASSRWGVAFPLLLNLIPKKSPLYKFVAYLHVLSAASFNKTVLPASLSLKFRTFCVRSWPASLDGPDIKGRAQFPPAFLEATGFKTIFAQITHGDGACLLLYLLLYAVRCLQHSGESRLFPARKDVIL